MPSIENLPMFLTVMWWIQTREGGGQALPYLNMVGNVCSIDPRFWHFLIPLGPFLCTAWSYWPPLSAEKNQFVSITFSCRDNLSQNWSYFSQKSVIWPFWNILYEFSRFSILLTVLRSFWPSFLQNLRSRWVHFFITCWTPLPKMWWSARDMFLYWLLWKKHTC